MRAPTPRFPSRRTAVARLVRVADRLGQICRLGLFCRLGLAIVLCLAALLAVPVLVVPSALAAAPQKAAQEPVEISGRIVAGLDKVFIKDAEGYCLVQGVDLSPYSGRNIQAKVLVIRKDQEYRTVRLLDYRIQSPDDDSPGAGGEVRQPTVTVKKKK